MEKKIYYICYISNVNSTAQQNQTNERYTPEITNKNQKENENEKKIRQIHIICAYYIPCK